MATDKMGRDEGRHQGPPPGSGDSSIGGLVAGGSDFEGTPPDELPDRPGEGFAKDDVQREKDKMNRDKRS